MLNLLQRNLGQHLWIDGWNRSTWCIQLSDAAANPRRQPEQTPTEHLPTVQTPTKHCPNEQTPTEQTPTKHPPNKQTPTEQHPNIKKRKLFDGLQHATALKAPLARRNGYQHHANASKWPL